MRALMLVLGLVLVGCADGTGSAEDDVLFPEFSMTSRIEGVADCSYNGTGDAKRYCCQGEVTGTQDPATPGKDVCEIVECEDPLKGWYLIVDLPVCCSRYTGEPVHCGVVTWCSDQDRVCEE